MANEIYTIGQGKRHQYTLAEDGFWWVRNMRNGVGWGAWITTGSRKRPDNIWYNPRAGKAHLPKD